MLQAMLEQSKEVAIKSREEIARQNAQEVADYEEFGADLAAALDAQELADAEEALRLGQELDDAEEQQIDHRERADFEAARHLIANDESDLAGEQEACGKDEWLARRLDAQLRKETVRVAKLERRERQAAEQNDLVLAEQLAADIAREEAAMRKAEATDRRLAAKLVKEQGKALSQLPQTEEKLRSLAGTINGEPTPSMRARLRAKLTSMRSGVQDITNKVAA